MTYCGIGALSFLNRLPDSLGDVAFKVQELTKGDDISVLTGLPSLEETIRWLAERQVGYFPHEEDESEEDDEGKGAEKVVPNPQRREGIAETVNEHLPYGTHYAGFSGRRNKKADTCYSFWVGASLAILKKNDLIDACANRRFLLECTQHGILGGFSDHPRSLPG
ncbi:MAG: hypothetical protein M1840_006501 [Geoglossum simile]|nr:MAG: hypothetical protein M1840_006501 [Geoglossum simile]